MADKSAADAASAEFKKSQRDKEAKKALAEYDAEGAAIRAKTERLRALRLARDAAAPKPQPTVKKSKAAGKAAAKQKPEQATSLSSWLEAEEREGRRG